VTIGLIWSLGLDWIMTLPMTTTYCELNFSFDFSLVFVCIHSGVNVLIDQALYEGQRPYWLFVLVLVCLRVIGVSVFLFFWWMCVCQRKHFWSMLCVCFPSTSPTMNFDSAHRVEFRTGEEMAAVIMPAKRRVYWQYYFIATMVAREWVTNPLMRLPHSLSTAAFHVLHANLQHLLTIYELANLPTEYLYPVPWVPAVVCAGDGPSTDMRVQSAHAALSIFSFIILIDGRVDVDALIKLVRFDIDADENWSPDAVHGWLCRHWGVIRTLSSPSFPLSLTSPPDVNVGVDVWIYCLRSVLVAQAGLCWRQVPIGPEVALDLTYAEQAEQNQSQRHELVPLSIWRHLGIDVHEFSWFQHAVSACACVTLMPCVTMCEVCHESTRCSRQGGMWLCARQCRNWGEPLDMTSLPAHHMRRPVG
jgi:hypothetical protein